MEFRTEIPIIKSNINLSHESTVLSVGSCFSENIGNKLKELRFNIDVNPFGILFNPLSILNCLNRIAEKKLFTENELSFYNGLWFSYQHHSCFSDIEKYKCLESINKRYTSAMDKLEKCDIIFITLGTSWVYELSETNKIVSNCHKIPNGNFKRYRLTVNDIVDGYKNLIEKLLLHNKNLNIIFTVSPIRHWKDGSHENQVSKSILFLAIEELLSFSDHISYFPAFEILMDELRDYRFYDTDMLHPSKQAINYIWEKFSSMYFIETTNGVIKQIEQLNIAAMHKPFNLNSENHKKFLNNYLTKAQKLQSDFPQINFSDFIKHFSNT